MRYRRWELMRILVCMLLMALPGCVKIDIGDKITAANIGEELTSLSEARELGVLTELEFRQLRRKLIESL